MVVAGRRSGSSQVLAESLGVDASTSLEDVLRRGDIDAVVICTPSGMHADTAVAAMDGGALLNQAVHSVDLMTWLLGVPDEVFCWTARLAHERIDVEDTAVATVRFPSGALGVVHATTAAYPGSAARLQVHGDKGCAVLDQDRLVRLITADGSPTDVAAAPEATPVDAFVALPGPEDDLLGAVTEPAAPSSTRRRHGDGPEWP